MFVDRQRELAFLDEMLLRNHPGPAQLILLYGRRRVGKTALLLHWINRHNVAYTYWAAEKEPATLQRRKLYARLLQIPIGQAPIFDSWGEFWEAAANILGQRRHVLILDEIPYANEADPATLSALQHAWDQHFQHANVAIVLCGSQVRTMESLQFHQSPLFGRLTGQWHLQPLPFVTLREFFPGWTAEERVAAYAIVGGVPAYLNWLNPELTLVENIHKVILAEGSMFLSEPTFLLYDEVREPQSYLAVLKSLGLGNHTLAEISEQAFIATSHLSAYLTRLQDLKMVERRLPATVTPAKRRRSRMGRYHIKDPYFRFYFRFIAPFYDYMPFDTDRVLQKVRQELRPFVGQTIFEELSRQWVTEQGKTGKLPFIPEIVGSHWSRRVQIDIVGVNWTEQKILLGECKWGDQAVNRQVVRELLEQKTPRVENDLPDMGQGWQIYYALFSRAGFTPSALSQLQSQNGIAVALATLDDDLT